MITLADFVSDVSKCRCSGPGDDYFGTAVKILNGADYSTAPPYDYSQRRIIRDRFRRQTMRSTREEKRNYGIFATVLALLIGAIIYIVASGRVR